MTRENYLKTGPIYPIFLSREDKQPKSTSLFIDPILNRTLVGHQLTLLKPQGNFLLGALDRVTAVAHITSNVLHTR